MRTCTKCETTKPIDQFSKNGNGKANFRAMNSIDKYLIDNRKTTCKACDAAYAREFRKKNPGYRGSGKNTKYPEKDRLLISAIRARLNVCLNNWRKRNGQVKPDLDTDYLYDLFKKQNGRCHYSGQEMKVETKHLLTLSIDKIEPLKGYVKGNVQWVCWAVNRAKGEMSERDFLSMCKVISERATTIP